MAELFLADDTTTEQQVVIKRILPYLSHEPEFVQMFLDEARIAAQLHHPNIITVFELGKLQESIFIAMEYVDGIDLRKIFQEELKLGLTVPYGIAAFITAKTCAGLYYAHNGQGVDGKPLGVIHRDVSPQNVMVGFDGRVKLVDFGIAKAGALMERSKPGVIKGKFLYLSPEQLSQDRVDHRADLFALGSMLYELTTGKSPFYKPTTEAVIYAIRAEEPPPPTALRSDYPPELSRIVMKCLVKDRTKRYQQADEIERDLMAFLAASLPTDTEGLITYVRRLMGKEDGKTTQLVAKKPATTPAPPPAGPPAGRKDATQELPNRRAASSTSNPSPGAAAAPPLGPSGDGQVRHTSPLTKKPTTTQGKPMGDPGVELPTKLASPSDLPRPPGGMNPISALPSRKSSGAKYQSAGAGMPEQSITHETLDALGGARHGPGDLDDGLPPPPVPTGDKEAEMTLPPMPERHGDDDDDEAEETMPLPAARVKKPTPPPPARTDRAIGEDEPVFDTGPVPSRDPEGDDPSLDNSLTPHVSPAFNPDDLDDDASATVSEAPRSRARRSGAGKVQTNLPLPTRKKGPGAGAVIAVLLALLAVAGVVWWLSTRASAPRPLSTSTTEAKAAPAPVPPDPPAIVSPRDETAAPEDTSGPDPKLEPQAPPEPVVTHPTPKPAQLVITFTGPKGTSVYVNKTPIPLGEAWESAPGKIEYEYRCPGKKQPLQKREITLDPQPAPVQIPLPCRR